MLAMAATTAIFTTSCENDNINPYDYANNGNNQENQGSTDALWQETMALTAPVSEISPFRTRLLATPSNTMSAKRTAIGTPILSPSALHGTSTSKSQPPATPTYSPNWKPPKPSPRAA